MLHSPSHTHIHTVHLLAGLCCSMRHNSGFSILPKDTSACRLGRLGLEPLTFRLADDHSTPSGTAAPKVLKCCAQVNTSVSKFKQQEKLFLCSRNVPGLGCYQNKAAFNLWCLYEINKNSISYCQTVCLYTQISWKYICISVCFNCFAEQVLYSL